MGKAICLGPERPKNAVPYLTMLYWAIFQDYVCREVISLRKEVCFCSL